MMTTVEITKLLASLTIFSQVLIVALIVIKVFPGVRKSTQKLITYQNQLNCSYIIALTATLGSLYYSEIAGYNPCKLCWYQRILMYPQVVLYLISMVIKDKLIKWYGMGLSLIGLILAGYHYLLQIDFIKVSSCSTVGFSISCSERFTTTFGYITIPMMALSAFALLLLIWSFKPLEKSTGNN